MSLFGVTAKGKMLDSNLDAYQKTQKGKQKSNYIVIYSHSFMVDEAFHAMNAEHRDSIHTV